MEFLTAPYAFPLVLITLGFLPSAAWLAVYVREDLHPEPKRKLLKVFAWGMLIAPLAVLAQYCVLAISGGAGLQGSSLVALVALAGVEEVLKYLVVRTEVADDPVFDEPTDAITYMVVAALGFAAVENVSIALSLAPQAAAGAGAAAGSLVQAAQVIGVRFAGATLLHAFSSAIVGWGLARHVFARQGLWIVLAALTVSVLLHGSFNYLILHSSEIHGGTLVTASAAMALVIIGIFQRLKGLKPSLA